MTNTSSFFELYCAFSCFNLMRIDQELMGLRPLIATKSTDNELETFQNNVLRPIIKFQQELWKKVAQRDPFLKKAKSTNLPISEKWIMVMKTATKNPSLKYQWIGMITGLLTNFEFDFYYNHKKELDKRIINMLVQRIVDSD